MFAISRKLIVAAVLAASRASADPASAQALFDAAVRLMESDRYEEACPMLAESDRLDASGGTALNLGYCWEQLRRFDRAYDGYLLSVEHYEASQKPERRDVAAERAKAIRDKVTVVHLSDEMLDPAVDGESRSPRKGALTVVRGRHTLSFVFHGDRRSLELQAGADEITASPPLEETEAKKKPDPKPYVAPVAPVVAPVITYGGRRTAALIVGGSALAIGAAAAVTGGFALDHESKSTAGCPADRCSEQGVRDHGTAQALAVTTDVMLVVSIAAVGIATYLFLASPSQATRRAISLSF